MRAPRPFIAALIAVIPLIGALASAGGGPTFVCRGDMVARRECCCVRHARTSLGTVAQAELRAACCCDVSQIKLGAQAAITASRQSAPPNPRLPPWQMDANRAWVSARPIASFVSLTSSARPPPNQLCPLLQKHSFLI